jgi:hypothetical protein
MRKNAQAHPQRPAAESVLLLINSNAGEAGRGPAGAGRRIIQSKQRAAAGNPAIGRGASSANCTV